MHETAAMKAMRFFQRCITIIIRITTGITILTINIITFIVMIQLSLGLARLGLGSMRHVLNALGRFGNTL